MSNSAFFIFGSKGLSIPGKGVNYSLLVFLPVFVSIATIMTFTRLSTERFPPETLAIQFEAPGLFT
jgi:hypothetical protein